MKYIKVCNMGLYIICGTGAKQLESIQLSSETFFHFCMKIYSASLYSGLILNKKKIFYLA